MTKIHNYDNGDGRENIENRQETVFNAQDNGQETVGNVQEQRQDFLAFIRNTITEQNRKKREMLVSFWNGFYNFAIDRCNITVESYTKSFQYKDEVMNLLQRKKDQFPLADDELVALQLEIEDLTMRFDEQSIFKSVPNIIKLLIRRNEDSAKDYLKKRLNINSYEYQLLNELGQYTIEALLVYVLGAVFTPL